ncbi:hypothetical protein, partial [Salipiger bermudensis]
ANDREQRFRDLRARRSMTPGADTKGGELSFAACANEPLSARESGHAARIATLDAARPAQRAESVNSLRLQVRLP